MTRKGINFVRLVKKYKNGWVAISQDFKRVVFYGKTLKETTKKAKNYNQKVYYFPTGEAYSDFVGFFNVNLMYFGQKRFASTSKGYFRRV